MPVEAKGAPQIPAAIRKMLTTEYQKAGFLDRYGADLWLVTIVFICALLHMFRYQIKNFLHSLKANWIHHRNNPLYMPIAGHVYRDPGQTPGQATMQNFSASLARIVTEVVKIFMMPILFVMSLVSDLIAAIAAILNAIRAFFNYLRNAIGALVHDIIDRTLRTAVPMQSLMAAAKGLMAKLSGTIAGMSFIGSGAFLTAAATLLWIIAIVLIILVLVGIFVGLMIALAYSVFPTAAPFGWPGIIMASIITLFSIVPGIWLLSWTTPLYTFTTKVVDRVIDAHSHSAPALPMCFDGETPIKLRGRSGPVKLRNVRPGDVLDRGGTVTAAFVLLARNQDVCRLGEVIVTGNHSVLHPAQGWIAARDHPQAVPLPDYDADCVYCINTSSKRVYVDGWTFADWDDLDESDFETLQHSSAPLPKRFGPEDIHPCLSGGHPAHAKVRLADGSSAQISSVVPGMRLLGGGTCLGTVELLDGSSDERRPLVRHLVVDTGRFLLNGSWEMHYDEGIEAYLKETPPQLFI